MAAFFLAVPAPGTGYLFGVCSPGEVTSALAPFRTENPELSVRLIVVGPPWAIKTLTSVNDHLIKRVTLGMTCATYPQVRRKIHCCGIHEAIGETEQGVTAVERLVRLIGGENGQSAENVSETALPPLRMALGPPQQPQRCWSPPTDNGPTTTFFFAHAGNACESAGLRYRMGVASNVEEAEGAAQGLLELLERLERKAGPGDALASDAVTLWSGELAPRRARQLEAALAAVLGGADGPDADLLDGFVAPVLAAVLGRGRGGARVRVSGPRLSAP